MKNPKQKALNEAIDLTRDLGKRYYGMGIDAMQGRNDQILAALGMGPLNRTGDLDTSSVTGGGIGPNAGEPEYLRRAFTEQRAGLADANALASRVAAPKPGMGFTGAAYLQPRDIGAEIARASSSSFLNQSLSKIGQTMNLLEMGMGAAGSAGNAGLTAASNQIQSAGMMASMSPLANTLMGALGGAGTIAGGMQKAGMFDPAPPQNTGMSMGLQPASMAPFGMDVGSNFFSPITSLTTGPTSFSAGKLSFGG